MTSTGEPWSMPGVRRPAAEYVTKVVALAAIYVVTGRLGLSLGALSRFATLVWPPTGISLAALLVLGYRYWPGVMLGAALVNLSIGASLPMALGMAAGNTLEALLGAYALRRIPGFRTSLDRFQDALGLIVLAAGLSTAVSATFGVVCLVAGGVVPLGRALVTWRAWWLGDTIGNLVVAPLLLTWGSLHGRPRRARVVEAVLLAVGVVGSSLWVFRLPSAGFGYLLAPVLVWAAIRFGPRGAARAAFGMSIVAVASTATGHGPFLHESLSESLISLQAFMAVTSSTFLLLGALTAERRRVQEELARHAATIEELYERAPCGYCSVDRDGVVVRMNDTALQWLGRSRDEVVGRFRFADFVAREDRSSLETSFAGFLAEGELHALECRMTRADGGHFHALLDGTSMGGGERAFVIADITERKLLEAANDEARGTLYTANSELARRNQEMEQFVYTVSHDLKGPLITISGFAGHLMRAVKGGDLPRAADAAERMERGAVRMRDIVEGLLELSRIGRVVEPPERIDLAALLAEVIDSHAAEIAERGVRVSMAPELPSPVADRTRLFQVFDNLVGNALRHACSGPSPSIEIEIGGAGDGGPLRYGVSDDGPGIPAEYQQRVFGIFERLSADPRGTGVGLAIVKQIVERHAGQVWIESPRAATGRGSTFWFTLDSAGGSASPPPRPK